MTGNAVVSMYVYIYIYIMTVYIYIYIMRDVPAQVLILSHIPRRC
jgi:hypothetical protein